MEHFALEIDGQRYLLEIRPDPKGGGQRPHGLDDSDKTTYRFELENSDGALTVLLTLRGGNRVETYGSYQLVAVDSELEATQLKLAPPLKAGVHQIRMGVPIISGYVKWPRYEKESSGRAIRAWSRFVEIESTGQNVATNRTRY
jgi:hypothetical protein